jgi:hypothetical protein
LNVRYIHGMGVVWDICCSTSRLGNEKYCSSNFRCIDARLEPVEVGTEKADLSEREEYDDDLFIELVSFGSSLFLRFVISEKNCSIGRI